jgi:nicotinamidase-related amidase
MGGVLRYPLTPRTVHLCVDMQRLFSADGPWPNPWMERVLPIVVNIAERHPSRTVFTRFITPNHPHEMPGLWQRYYRRWRNATRDRMDHSLLDLMPPLDALCPPAVAINKSRYSGFSEPALLEHLHKREADGIVITGSETDMCVLATVLGAVDLGFRVIIVRDAVCSSSDEGHDALMKLYVTRYSEQIEVTDAETILAEWA